MTVLPIIERELRVRARSRGTYWMRFAVVLAALLGCLPQLMWSGPFTTPATIGPALLNAIVGAGFIFSCAACLLTADLISSERREGTLGLLLITRVRVFDVLLGKLGSSGLTSLCALVAFLPLLMLPVLAGGVTGGEAFRMALALPNALFVALTAGLWASAREREWSRSARTALLLVAALVLGPTALEYIWVRFLVPGPTIALISPLSPILYGADIRYKVSPELYWISLALVQATGWVLLAGAILRLRSGWREERAETDERAAAIPEEHPAEAMEAPVLARPLADDESPIAWLLRRRRGLSAIFWAGALVSLGYHGLMMIVFRLIRATSVNAVVYPLGLATMVLEGALFAWGASRFFVEARRTGELELLLTSPAGATQLVSAQWEALKRVLRWPILLLFAPILLQVLSLVAVSRQAFPANFPIQYGIMQLLACAGIFFSIGALCWLGMWFGLRSGSQGWAILWTVGLVKGVPYLISMLSWAVLGGLIFSSSRGGASPFWWRSWAPQILNLVYYLFLIRLARGHLQGELRGIEPLRFDLWSSISSAVRDAVRAWRKARHWTPS